MSDPANFETSSAEQESSGRSARRRLVAMWRGSRVETIVFIGLLAGLAWAPYWLGGNRLPAWGVNGILFPSLAILFEVAILLTGRRHPIGLARIAWPAFFFLVAVVWIFLQMSGQGGSLFAHPVWGMAAEVLELPLDVSVSVNRGETAIALVRLLTAAAVFWLSLQLCRNRERAHVFLRVIGFIVAVYAAYGLILSALFGGAIPGFPFVAPVRQIHSTFVNQNNFATYAGLGLLVNVALVLRLYRKEAPQDDAGSLRYRMSRFIEATGQRGWFLLGTTLVVLTALLGTASRGGILSAALGLFALVALVFARQRRSWGEQIEAILLVTLALVGGFAFFGDQIIGRIASSGVTDPNRLSVDRIVVKAILDTPLLGFGYGNFQDIFPMYRDQSISTYEAWDKAHNTYLEVWLGLGVVFGTALMGALAWLAFQCFVGAVKRRRDATPAVVAAAASLLVGIHSLVDFSLQIEGVALTYMAILGAGVAQSESSRAVISD